MEIRQLEAFAAVLSAGNVTAAARLLDRSQPVVSRQIQDLEQELGFTLFIRTRPQVTLTSQGGQFYDEVRNVLAGLQQLDIRSREIAQGQTRPLHVAATFSLSSSLLPVVIGRLEQSNPLFDYKMVIQTVDPERVVQQVADGHADVGVTSLPLDLGRCRLHWSGQAPCVLALPLGHPLAGRDVVKADELGDATVIAMSNRTRLRHRLSTALLRTRDGEPPPRHIETTSSLSALMLVRAGIGVALIDPLTALNIVPGDVVFKPLDTYVPYMLGVISHRERQLSDDGQRLVQALWDYVCENVPQFVSGDHSGIPVIPNPAGNVDHDETRL